MGRWAIALLFAGTLFSAAASEVGDFAPLTNTRYVPVVGAETAQLVSDGTDLHLFFSVRDTFRMVRVGDGVPRTARVVLEGMTYKPAVVWTGTHFFVAGMKRNYGIVATTISRDGRTIREPYVLDEKDGSAPIAAFNGRVILLLYEAVFSGGIRAMTLDASGSLLANTKVLPGFSYSKVIASNGTGFVAVIEQGSKRFIHRFDRDGALEPPPRETIFGGGLMPAAIATDGQHYLILIHDGIARTLKAVPLYSNGSVGAVVTTIGMSNAFRLADLEMTWRGDGYFVVYRRHESADLQALTVDRDGGALSPPETLPPTSPFSPVSLTSVHGRTFMAYTTTDLRVPVVREMRDDAEEIAAAYGAVDQTLEASASSAGGTLFVWREHGTLHTGFRTKWGDWSEQSIALDARDVIVGSNGSEFLLVGRGSESWQALRLSPTGRRMASPASLLSAKMTELTGIVWTGHRYVVVGATISFINYGIVGYDAVVALGIDPTLTVTGPIRLREGHSRYYGVRIATDGSAALVVWMEGTYHPLRLCATRLGTDLQKLDAEPVVLREGLPAGSTPLVWDGEHYVVAWRGDDYDGIHGTRVDREGRRRGVAFEVPAYAPERLFAWITDLDMVAVDGTLGLLWRDGSQRYESTQFRLIRDRQVSVDAAWPLPVSGTRARLAISGNRVVSAMSLQQNSPPFHGASRLMMVLIEQENRSLPPRPGAPELLARPGDTPSSVRLFWRADENTVNGYRIETRIDDGAWNEVERWMEADSDSTTLHLPPGSQKALFRIRAWNDGGAGAYSQEAELSSPRRRSVR